MPVYDIATGKFEWKPSAAPAPITGIHFIPKTLVWSDNSVNDIDIDIDISVHVPNGAKAVIALITNYKSNASAVFVPLKATVSGLNHIDAIDATLEAAGTAYRRNSDNGMCNLQETAPLRKTHVTVFRSAVQVNTELYLLGYIT